MATAWENPIKSSGHLTIFPGPSITGSSWKGVFDNALLEFNRLAKANGLSIAVVNSGTPPDPSGVGGADVQFEAGSGSVTFTTFGQTVAVAVDGKSIGGNTQQVKTVVKGVTRIAKAFVVVPATPTADTSPPRLVGDDVRLFIAVHELLHACGLDNSDHNSADVFHGSPQLRAGKLAKDDKVEVNGPKRLPPFFLDAKTVGLIKSIW